MKPGVFQGKKFPFTPKRRRKSLGTQCNNIIDTRHDLAAFRSKLANVSWLRSYIAQWCGRDMGHGVRGMRYGVWDMRYAVTNMGCRVWVIQCGCGLWGIQRSMWPVLQARALIHSSFCQLQNVGLVRGIETFAMRWILQPLWAHAMVR